MAITDKKTGVWGLDQVYNKINQGSIWTNNRSGLLMLIGNWWGIPAPYNFSSPVQIPGTKWVTANGGGYSGSGSTATASGESTTGEINYIITIDNASGGNATSTDVATGYAFTENITGGDFQDP